MTEWQQAAGGAFAPSPGEQLFLLLFAAAILLVVVVPFLRWVLSLLLPWVSPPPMPPRHDPGGDGRSPGPSAFWSVGSDCGDGDGD